MQNRHVVIVLDRAGAVPSDGETHQGIFDIALFRPVPNLSIISVAGKKDMDLCLDWAVNKSQGPVVIRWPKMACPSELEPFSVPVEPGKGVLLQATDFAPSIFFFWARRGFLEKKKVLLVCTGSVFSETLRAARALVLDGIDADIYSLRFIKPFNEKYFAGIAKLYCGIVFIEDGVKMGGISEWLESFVHGSTETSFLKTALLAFPDRFVANGNREQILEEAGLSSEKIVNAAKELMRI